MCSKKTQKSDYNFYFDKRNKDGRRFINPDGCTFYLSITGPAEVEKIIDELNIKKSIGTFGVLVSLLKKFKTFFSFWLSEMVNFAILNQNISRRFKKRQSLSITYTKKKAMIIVIIDRYLFFCCLVKAFYLDQKIDLF